MNADPPRPPETPKPAFACDYARMWVVRYQRSELLDAGLIDRYEYAALCSDETTDKPGQGSPSPRRLEGYDDLRKQLDAQRAALATVTQELARWKVCDLCEEPMEVPGFCHKGLTESEEAYQFMLDQAQTRCEQAEADLATARARLAAVQELLDDGGYCDCESEPCSCFGGAVAEALTADAAARSGKE